MQGSGKGQDSKKDNGRLKGQQLSSTSGLCRHCLEVEVRVGRSLLYRGSSHGRMSDKLIYPVLDHTDNLMHRVHARSRRARGLLCSSASSALALLSSFVSSSPPLFLCATCPAGVASPRASRTRTSSSTSDLPPASPPPLKTSSHPEEVRAPSAATPSTLCLCSTLTRSVTTCRSPCSCPRPGPKPCSDSGCACPKRTPTSKPFLFLSAAFRPTYRGTRRH